MSRAIASELLKLRTTRTFFGLVGAAVVLGAVIAGLLAAFVPFEADDGLPPGEDLVGLAGFAPLFALVVGLLAVTTEFRHGTITPSLLAVPSRGRLVAAKVAAHLIAGFLLGLAAVVLDLALVEGLLSARGIESGTTAGEAAGWTAGVAVASALAAALGVGVGALVRNQVGAIVGGFAWILIAEPLLTIVPALEEPVTKYGVGGLVDGADGITVEGGSAVLAQLPASLVLAAYVALAAVAGAALLRRRDVTA